jgi:hypothetical protein
MLPRKNPFLLKRFFWSWVLIFALLGLTPTWGETSLTFPTQYGEIIHQWDKESPGQLYIIGIGHRDTLTRANGDNTSRVQAEVYKIGEWLIHNRDVGLLLPEGFFKSPATKSDLLPIKASEKEITCPEPTDMLTLEQRLADTRTFINAEMLLKAHHPVKTAQVEDPALYMEVRNDLLKLVNNPAPYCDPLLISELDYLQEKRTAAMLQNIPGVIDQEFRKGAIHHRKAIFTIGLAHLRDIIRYIDERKITIHPPASAPGGGKEYSAGLKLREDKFAVSIIIPRTLANDQKVLEMNRLDKIVAESRRQTALHASSLLY